MSFGAVAVGVGSAVAGAAVSSALAPSGGGGGAAAADPFAADRPIYRQKLLDLINNPSSITSDPGYNFGLNTGINSVQGSAAAKGMLNSGNALSDVYQFGQNYATNYLQNQELFLAQLAGANVGSPGTAGQINQQNYVAGQQAASAVGNQVGSAVGQGIGNWLGGGGYSGGNPFAGSGGNTYGFTSGVSDPSYGVSGGMFGG